MKLNPFVERRLRQLVREAFERADVQALLRQIVREELYGYDRPVEAVEQTRPKLRAVK